ncbi:MAG: hypothetical protein ACI8RZ_001600 [Myxococcota bacterium]|jgi:hypothetical protein
MNFTHSPERMNTAASRSPSDPFDVVLYHLIAIESAADTRRRAAREDASRREAQLSLFDRQLTLF